MIFHILVLPHVELGPESVACAYSSKIVKFCKMMSARGHTCVTYGGAVAPGHSTHVQIIDIPPIDHNRLYDVDWQNGFKEYCEKAIPAVAERASGQDFLLASAGTSHQPVADALPDLMCVEYGIGYRGVFANFQVFESHAWQAHVYGQQGIDDGRWYHQVIPNYFDVDDFVKVPVARPREHLIWMGRFVERKGPATAYQIAQAAGRQLIMAGQGVLENKPGKIVGAELEIEGPGFIHIGPVDKRKRSSFLATAHAFLMCTHYWEPFGGVAVEALMSGTPVISTDFGAFPEFVIDHWNGGKFHTLKEALKFVEEATHLDRNWIQQAARKRFSLEAVGASYEEYFGRLLDLYGDGWSTL